MGQTAREHVTVSPDSPTCASAAAFGVLHKSNVKKLRSCTPETVVLHAQDVGLCCKQLQPVAAAAFPLTLNQTPRFSSENQEKALQSLATVLRYLTVTAERVSPEQMRQALEPVLRYEGDKLMSTLAQQWLEQGRQEGLQQGMQQGLWAMRQNIIELLADRWQIPAQRFQDRLKVIEDMETLRLLVRRVATVDDVAEFEQALNTLTKGE